MVSHIHESFLRLLRSPFIMEMLRRNRRLEPSKLRKLQGRKLRAMVEHSYRNVAYYHYMFKEANLSYSSIRNIDDLEKIPISKKRDIIDSPPRSIVATNLNSSKCYTFRTSGSTSGPMTIYFQKNAKLMGYLQLYLWQLNCGDRITNRQLAVDIDWVPIHPIQKLGIFKTKFMSVFDDTETQIKEVREFDPHTVVCLPSFINVFAKEIKERNIKGIRPHLVFTGGETLGQHVRKLAQEVFGAEIFDNYGTTEVGGIAKECAEHVDYHIESDSTLVEITRKGETVSAGEEGEITVTNLTNYAMPFIRYNLEDLGTIVADNCSCGNLFPKMKITAGRKSDLVRLPDGKRIPALPLWGSLCWVQGIKQLQVVQERIDRFIVKIEKDSNFTDKTCNEAEKILRQKLGNTENVEINVTVVDEIPRGKRGKLKQFVSKIPLEDA